MEAKGLTSILNVSATASTFSWFEHWGMHCVTLLHLCLKAYRARRVKELWRR